MIKLMYSPGNGTKPLAAFSVKELATALSCIDLRMDDLDYGNLTIIYNWDADNPGILNRHLNFNLYNDIMKNVKREYLKINEEAKKLVMSFTTEEQDGSN